VLRYFGADWYRGRRLDEENAFCAIVQTM